MGLPAQTVKEFVRDSYRLVSAASPTVPLHGSDTSDGVRIVNDLLHSYSATGLLLTVARTVNFTVEIGQNEITFASPAYTPEADVTDGRLANLQDAWLSLQGVTYPLIIYDRNVFQESYKYDPQQGLPRYAIVYYETDLTRIRIYPGPSQVYSLSVYGKFELPDLDINGTMEAWPRYFQRYFKFALAKDVSMYKGRANAWTEKLEDMLLAAKLEMESVSTIDLAINSETDAYLNGKWRVIAGV